MLLLRGCKAPDTKMAVSSRKLKLFNFSWKQRFLLQHRVIFAFISLCGLLVLGNLPIGILISFNKAAQVSSENISCYKSVYCVEH